MMIVPHDSRSVKLSDQVVSRSVRERIYDEYAPLKKDDRYKRFACYSLLGPHFVNQDNGRILVPDYLLAHIEGKKDSYQSRHYHAETFLKEIQEHVFPDLVYSRYSKQDNRCRALLQTGTERLEELLATSDEDDRVYFLSGKKWSRAAQKKEHDERCALAEERMAQAVNQDQRMMMEYMNTLPLFKFNRLIDEHYAQAKEKVLQEPDLYKRHILLTHLRNIRDMPKPFYHPVGRNARFFTAGIPTLRKDIRAILLQGCLEVDIKSCQCAIAAFLWNAKEVKAVLSSGVSFWDALMDEMGVADVSRPEAKPILKMALYAIFFGMEETHVDALVSREFRGYTLKGSHVKQTGVTIEQTKRFTDLPLIQSLLQGRERYHAQIQKDGGAFTPYGFVPYSQQEPFGTYLSAIMQSYEQYLVKGLYEVCNQREKTTILSYQYDGVVISTAEKNKIQFLAHTLQRALLQKAKNINISIQIQTTNL